jgi:PKD repeat protein
MKLSLFLTLGLVALGTLVCAQGTTTLQPSAVVAPSDKMETFTGYEIVDFPIDELLALRPSTGKTAVNFTLVTANGDLPFSLEALELRGPDYQLKETGPRGGKVLPSSRNGQFLGRLQTADGAVALFTLDDNFVMGSWKQGETMHYLEPLWRFWPAAPRDAYVLYTEDGVAELNDFCGFHGEPTDSLAQTVPPSENRSVGECFEVEIALAADFEIFQALGNNVASVENFMLNNLANVQTNYDDEFDDELRYVVVATVIATSNATDPWTNSTNSGDVLLPNFRSWGNSGGFGTTYDVASLWSNRNFDGSTIGVAYVGGICGFSRYNVLQSFTNNSNSLRVLWSHELGHNFGSFHDGGGGFIMSPSVNGSITWSGQSQNAVNNGYQNSNCFQACPAPPLPDPPVAAAFTSFTELCDGSVVTVIDESTGEITQRNWQFPGGTPSSSSAVAPEVFYPGPGTYTATLTVSNDFGSDFEQITFNITRADEESATVLFHETFDGDEIQMTVDNPDFGNTWEFVETEGNIGSVSAVVNNFDNNFPGQIDRLISREIDLTGVLNPTLDMEYAYRRFNATLSDQLRVIVSGSNTSAQTLFFGSENGNGNFATGTDFEERFIPNEESDWCFDGPSCITIDLSAFANDPAVVITVENINDFGNNMYVDNILVFGNCSSNTLPVEWLGFTAEPLGKASAKLDWSVNQDEAHAGFTVQRARASSPGAWTNLGWLDVVAGTNNVNYSFLDQTVAGGETYLYRLEQQDVDGSTNLSLIRTVSFDQFTATTVTPNPTSGELRIVSALQDGAFELFTPTGQKVASGQLSDGRATVNLSSLPQAVYVLRVGEEVLRVVKN